MEKRRGFLVFCFVSLSLLLSPRPLKAEGCPCSPQKSVEEAYQNSSAVFVGRVEHLIKSPLRAEMYEVRFVVFSNYKGTIESERRVQVVYTPLNDAQCSYKFISGQEYLVYAVGNPAFYKTDTCSRTNVLDTAQEDIGKLVELAKKEEGK